MERRANCDAQVGTQELGVGHSESIPRQRLAKVNDVVEKRAAAFGAIATCFVLLGLGKLHLCSGRCMRRTRANKDK